VPLRKGGEEEEEKKAEAVLVEGRQRAGRVR
jgi:hypothetical protein